MVILERLLTSVVVSPDEIFKRIKASALAELIEKEDLKDYSQERLVTTSKSEGKAISPVKFSLELQK